MLHPQYGDSGSIPRRKAQNVREIEVQRNEAAPFADTSLKNSRIAGSAQSLLRNGVDVMSITRQEVRPTRSKILIELQFHVDRLLVTSTIRSRLISAP